MEVLASIYYCSFVEFADLLKFRFFFFWSYFNIHPVNYSSLILINWSFYLSKRYMNPSCLPLNGQLTIHEKRNFTNMWHRSPTMRYAPSSSQLFSLRAPWPLVSIARCDSSPIEFCQQLTHQKRVIEVAMQHTTNLKNTYSLLHTRVNVRKQGINCQWSKECIGKNKQ